MGFRCCLLERGGVKTLHDCEAFLQRQGLATVLPSKDALLPCLLWEARGHREREPEWDDALGRVWDWKDELPARKTAWFGRLFGDRVVLLHRRLLEPFLAWRGRPDVEALYGDGLLTREAYRVYTALEKAEGPLGRTPLRRASGLSAREDAARFDRGCRDLERRMLLTRAGRSTQSAGWDANAYALVERWFPAEGGGAGVWSPEGARGVVAEALEQAAPEASERHLARWMKEI